MKIGTASLYLVAGAQLRAGALADLIPELAAAGVDIIQVREKEMTKDEIRRVAEPILASCRDMGVPLIINDYPDIASELGADGVHVGQDDASVATVRGVTSGIVGLSTHDRAQILASEAAGPDYIAVGPVYETPTKPGRPGVGLDLLTFAAENAPVPWFAIGGIDGTNLERVVAAGATRVVVVRAITDALDPPAAAAALRAALPG